jgi:hypothetical protein
MCEEMTAIPVNRGGGRVKNDQKKWRTEEEEKHKGR